MASPRQVVYEFGPFHLDPIGRNLLKNGTEVDLRKKVFDLLVVLVENHGHFLSNESLLQKVWDQQYEGSEYKIAATVLELRKCLGESILIENRPGQGYRFSHPVIQHQNQAGRKFLPPTDFTPPPPGGAVPLNSSFYQPRDVDDELYAAISRRDSVILVKGSPQTGKTSLLARGGQKARELHDARVINTVLRPLEEAKRTSLETLMLSLAEEIAAEFELSPQPHQIWNSYLSASNNFQRYFQRHVLEKIPKHVVWVIDDVDNLFATPYRNEIFAIFRWWHNLRALEPEGPWGRLTLALGYATEAHLFISDLNQSPFNVGTRLSLEDFTRDKIVTMNQLYGRMLENEEEIDRYYELLSGHPFLSQVGLYEMSQHKLTFAAIEARADHDDGIFGDHLRRLWSGIEREPDFCEALSGLLRNQPLSSLDIYYRLRSAGVLRGDSLPDARLRCNLYVRYLRKRLTL